MRPARALIDLNALRHNYQLAKSLSGSRALAVIKADAYGHGAIACAQALAATADGFAVACLEEALELRAAGIQKPILLLEGFFEPDELPCILREDLWCVIHSQWQIEALERTPLAAPLVVWLKMDTGMHRVGLAPQDYAAAWHRLQASGKVSELVKMSHFARADESDPLPSQLQLQCFEQTCSTLPGAISLANSPAVLAAERLFNHPLRQDWVRPGILLYGADPVAGGSGAPLRAVMTLESRIIAIRDLPAGEAVGYGARFVCPQPMRIGVVAMGYADGYPRHAPNGTPVHVAGQPTQLVGRVSMDMLTVDLTGIPEARVGSPVELWGTSVSVDEVAQAAGTIAYQLLCNLKRCPRHYQP